MALAGTPASPVSTSNKVKLVIYPGEETKENVTVGRIYVVNGGGESYDIAGGPPTRRLLDDWPPAVPTPAGHYVLGNQEHHVSLFWPNSVVPWGVIVRQRNNVIEYQSGNRWIAASGSTGKVTKAILLGCARDKKPCSVKTASRMAFDAFFDDYGRLISPWAQNDFGPWAWNLKRHGRWTPYYIHTTPKNEAATMAGNAIHLVQSHGCIHIRPSDRDEMMQKGYLRGGVEVQVMSYGQKGPPR